MSTTEPDRARFSFLDDYCPHCNPAGDQADSCVRLSTLTDPDAVTWHGGKRLICHYQCHGCGHQWRRSDLWNAECAGFDQKGAA